MLAAFSLIDLYYISFFAQVSPTNETSFHQTQWDPTTGTTTVGMMPRHHRTRPRHHLDTPSTIISHSLWSDMVVLAVAPRLPPGAPSHLQTAATTLCMAHQLWTMLFISKALAINSIIPLVRQGLENLLCHGANRKSSPYYKIVHC